MVSARRILALASLARRASTLAPAAQALKDAVAAFRAAGVAEPDASAEWLLAHALGSTERSAATSAARRGDVLAADASTRFDALVARRLRREPVQYCVGAWAFRDFELEVAPPTLIPRPETEELVDLILGWWGASGPARFADVGAGTGCLGLALLRELPAGSSCVALDVAPAAVALARRNAELLGLGGAYSVVERRAADLEGEFDFVASNPPYIPSADMASLEPEVAAWEDPGALDGGPDGLDVAREVLGAARGRAPAVWLELDPTGPDLLARDFACEAFADASGRPRFVRVDL